MDCLTAEEILMRSNLSLSMMANTELYKHVEAATEAEYTAYHRAVDTGTDDDINAAKVALVLAELAAAKGYYKNER